MSGDHLNHHNSPNGWQFGSPSMYQGIQMASSSSCPQVSMPESFYTNPWTNPTIPQNSGFAEGNAAIGKSVPLPPPRLDMGMFLPTNPGMLPPPSLSDFPADSSFIERAAKFSSFGAGNLSALVNPFGYSNVQAPKNEGVNDGSMSGSPVNYQRDNGSGREETPDMANLSGDSSSRGLSAKKRKNSGQDMELDQVQEEKKFSAEIPKEENPETKQNVECSSSSGKSNGKNAKGSTDGAKQDYVHVRARRGQATNSHSLAERVRRERISERMQYLQDLVPGCSKVTGKAVMLDEIINYVQSLQRQVEFLSMKLAAVNPSIELNIEGLMSKNMLQSRVGPSPAIISPELLHPQFLQSQQGLVHNGIPNIVNHADAHRRAVTAQFTTTNGFKDPTPQMSNWETEIQNMVQNQMNFGTDPSPITQEFNAKPNNGFSQ